VSDRRLLVLGFLADLAVGAIIAGLIATGCYAHGPKPPTCAADPNQPGCLGGLHDERPPK
jgi:hypothetical protein